MSEDVKLPKYKCINTRRCYWMCQGCLRGHQDRCSMKCPDYLSVAKVKRYREKI